MQQIITAFQAKFPNCRAPHRNTLSNVREKQINLGTVNNVNSAKSSGITKSGRRTRVRTEAGKNQVKQILDRDSVKMIGDRQASPVNTARRNTLGISKSSWSRIVEE